MTGLIAQQQCVGPLHTPLANVAVTALSHFGGFSTGSSKDGPVDTAVPGAATSIGEQPIIGLVNVGCGRELAIDSSVCADPVPISCVSGCCRGANGCRRSLDQYGVGANY